MTGRGFARLQEGSVQSTTGFESFDCDAYNQRILTIILSIVIIMVNDQIWSSVVITIQASEFKAKCLALMDQVARTGETIIVSKHGKPIAELHAHRAPRSKSLLGVHEGRIKVSGDIVSGASSKLWEAMK